jgi:ligand-binding sensor domain-containing protein/signal transduction histidine kinase
MGDRVRYPIARACGAMCILVACACAQPLGSSPDASHAAHSAARPEVRLDPEPIRFPVIDGTDIRFSHLTPAQAPSQTRVSQIIQDDQGFLWFGTQQGLNRYDGYRCKVFTHDPKRPESFGGSYVYSLFKDRSGSIWVGSEQSFDRFDPATESFAHFHIDNRAPIVLDVSQDSSGTLWLSTEMGLYRLNPENGQVARFSHHGDDPYSLSSDQIQSTGEDRAGSFWVGTGVGMDRFDRETGKVTLQVALPKLIPGSLCSVACRSFHEDRYGVFWILYGSGSGLAILDLKRNRLTEISLYEEQRPGVAILTAVNTVLEDHNGTMWFGTMGQGLLKYDRTHRKFVRYRNNSEDPESLAEDGVISLFEDREGNIWTGFHAVIPDFFANVQSPFQVFRPAVADRSNAGENLVNAIYEDRDGNVWMGAGGVLYRIDHRTGRYERYYPSGHGVKAEVLAITQDSSGKLWIGTFGYGLTRFDPKTERTKIYHHKQSDSTSLSNDTVARILINPDRTMWVSTWDGLDRFDPASGAFVTYKMDRNQTEPYYSITRDREGFLWLGSKSGLFRFDPSTGQFKGFIHSPHDPNSLSNDSIDSVHQDRTGAIWVGTQDGLDKMDPDKLTFTAYTTKDGLAGNAVSCILTDDQNDLWMSTNKGLSKFDSRAASFKNYTVADGLPGDDLTGWDACFRSSSGEMLFGGFAGAVGFQPRDVVDNTYIPPIVFTDFHLARGSTPMGSASPLNKSITAATFLKLPYEQRFFSVEFAALSFRSPATNRYRYMLQGLDSNWHEVASDQRLVSYTALPAGTYKLRVQGATSRGAWDQPGTALQLTILPPWWGTWWFRAFCACSLLWMGWRAYRNHLSQITKQFNIKLEARVEERSRVARELHDTLLQTLHGLMFQFQAASNLMVRRPEEAKRSLDDAVNEAKKALVESRDAIQGLRSEPIAKGNLSELLALTSRELADSNANEHPPIFDLIEEGERQTLSSNVSNEVCRIALELMRNAYQHAHAQRIEAEIRYGDSMLRLRIRDDGQGIDPKVLKEGGKLGHWGLRGVRERADRIAAHLDLWSEPGHGTEAELEVPAAIAYEGYRDSYRAKLLRKVKSRAQRS